MGFQQPGQVDSQPGTNRLLQNQENLITELKLNFQKEMFELKQQMVKQQDSFKEQLEKLGRQQQDDAVKKGQADDEITRIRQ